MLPLVAEDKATPADAMFGAGLSTSCVSITGLLGTAGTALPPHSEGETPLPEQEPPGP